MFHEQVQNWNLSRGALRWGSLAPLFGALTLHGLAALLLAGPHAAPASSALGELAVGPVVTSSLYFHELSWVAEAAPGSPAAPQAIPSAPGGETTGRFVPTAPATAAAAPVQDTVALNSDLATPAPLVELVSGAAAPDLDIGATSAQDTSSGAVGSSRENGPTGARALGRGGGRGVGRAIDSAWTEARAAQRARLVPESLRCADLFPYAARSDRETLAVEVAVSSTGSARASRVVSGHRHEAVFDAAALACARRLQFVPAQSVHGAQVEGRAVVRLRFERAS